MDSLDWANRFVPLPPTEFPEDIATDATHHEQPLMQKRDNTLQSPLTAPSLPCLQDIAGIDPFFTPMQSPKSSQQPSAANAQAIPPQVEVIGQQATQETAGTVPSKSSVQTSASMRERTKVQVEFNDRSSLQEPIVEIDEYRLATQEMPHGIAAEPQAFNEHQAAAENPGSTDIDISSYWSQDNVASFIPGITPVDAYPVCQEYVEQVLASNESESITLSDIQLEQLLTTVANSKSETVSENGVDNETNQTDEQADVDTRADSTVEQTLVPLQVNPFDDETFESTIEVSGTKISNRLTQDIFSSTAVTNAACDVAAVEPTETPELASEHAKEQSQQVDFITPMAEISPKEDAPVECTASQECFEPQKSSPIVPHTPNLAARQLPLAKSVDTQPTSAPLGMDQTISQLAIEEDAGNREPESGELFESVEKSLSELQMINHCDSNENFSPATNPAEVLSAIAAPSIGESTLLADLIEPQQEPTASQHVDIEQLDADQPSAPEFEPIDLTAHLPSVQNHQVQPPAEPEATEVMQATPHAPEAAAQMIAEPEAAQQPPVEAPFDTPTPLESQPPAEPEATEVMQATPHAPEAAAQMIAEPEAAQQPPVEASFDTPTPLESEPEPDTDPECQVIEVDGKDGYDFIDLKAFNVAHATFCPGKIFLDDGKTKFQIQYRNLKLAVFANDFQVNLS